MKIMFARIEQSKWKVVEADVPEGSSLPEGTIEIKLLGETNLHVGDVVDGNTVGEIATTLSRSIKFSPEMVERITKVATTRK